MKSVGCKHFKWALTAPDPDETKYDHEEKRGRKKHPRVFIACWSFCCYVGMYGGDGGGSEYWGCVRKTKTDFNFEV